MEHSTPRNIEENPSLPDGQYDALIRDIRLRRSSRETQIWLLFYLPDQQMHVVTPAFEMSSKTGYHGHSAHAQPDHESTDLGALHGKT